MNRPEKYTVTPRGRLPGHLVESVSSAHAKAILMSQERRNVDGHTPDSEETGPLSGKGSDDGFKYSLAKRRPFSG